VDRLGKGEDISEEFHPPIVRDVSGHEVASCGTISLEWMWGPEGTKVFDCKFFVFTNSDHLDVIFGVEYIIAQGLIDTPRDVIAPLTPHKKQDTSKYHSNSSHKTADMLKPLPQRKLERWPCAKKSKGKRRQPLEQLEIKPLNKADRSRPVGLAYHRILELVHLRRQGPHRNSTKAKVGHFHILPARQLK